MSALQGIGLLFLVSGIVLFFGVKVIVFVGDKRYRESEKILSEEDLYEIKKP